MSAMRLVDLEPRWHAHDGNPHALFVFLCPHCAHTERRVRLSCTLIPIKAGHQHEIFEAAYGKCPVVVGCKFLGWKMKRGPSFETITITPSLDASASGHWHGFIKNGEIT